MNTADFLLQTGEDSRAAVIAKGETYSYRQLRAGCARLVGELLAAGIVPGERVGIAGENSFAWIAAYLATLKVKAVAVPFPTVVTPKDMERNVAMMGCRFVFADAKVNAKFGSAFGDAKVLIPGEILNSPGPTSWPDPDESRIDLDSDAALMLTSGTTARPRAVRITHRNIQANTTSIVDALQLDWRDRILVVLPFYYCFGTSLLHTHLRVGGCLAVCNTFAYPETAIEFFKDSQCNSIAGVPSTYQTLLRGTSFGTRGLPGLEKIQQAGGKLQPVYLEELMKVAPGARIFTMYGQTEATARLSFLPPEMLRAKLGSVGRGIPGVSLRVLDESGNPVNAGEIGEIVASGDSISPGYLDDAEATAEKFPDGCLRSGDLATVDEDHYIYIVDRKSDFIKSLGHRVSSQEIESKIAGEIGEVVGVAAVGQPDPVNGEAIRVFVTLREGVQKSPEDILRHCRATMARHMVPKEVVILDRMPVNASGKIVKSVLRSYAS